MNAVVVLLALVAAGLLVEVFTQSVAIGDKGVLGVSVSGSGSGSGSPLLVTLFYEADCPDCQEYIQNQLMPAWSKQFKDDNSTLIDLVPYGNAEQKLVHGKWKFSCQHGPAECYHNKIHACAVQQACGGMSTVACDKRRLDQALSFIQCHMTATADNLATATAQCVTGLPALTEQYIHECAMGPLGNQLLGYHGNRTKAFTPQVDAVPTVAINGVRDSGAEESLQLRVQELQTGSGPALGANTDTADSDNDN